MSFFTSRLENLTVPRKLGLGFGIILLLVIALAAVSLQNLRISQQHVEKITLASSIADAATQANQSRNAYQSTSDKALIAQNETEIQKAQAQVAVAQSHAWSARDRESLAEVAAIIGEYRKQRDTLVGHREQNTAIRVALTKSSNDMAQSWLTLKQQLLASLRENPFAVDLHDKAELALGAADLVERFAMLRFHVRGMLFNSNANTNKAALDAVEGLIAAMQTLRPQLAPAQQTMLDGMLKLMEQYRQQVASFPDILAQERAAIASMDRVSDSLLGIIGALNANELQEARDTVEHANLLLLLVAGAALVLGTLTAWVITRQIVQPLGRTLKVAQRIATGDLTGEFTSTRRDELGKLEEAMHTMQEFLSHTVTSVRRGVQEINSGAREIAAGNADLSSRSEQQAASLEQTAASMEELAATVKNNADNARQASTLAHSASEVAQRGGDAVNRVVTTMEGISDSSRRIAEIIGVIEGIAFQTNILALNAAVEAARAGEQGKGFSVVANEVRSLAQRSASAAKEIKELIGDSVVKVTAGSQQVEQASSTMQEIVASVRRATDIIGEISAASIEQAGGIDQVNLAVGQMDQTTQQNAALVEQAAAASASLEDQADQLAQAVAVFQISQTDTASLAAPVRQAAPRAALPARPAAKRLAPAAAPRRPAAAAPRVTGPAKTAAPAPATKPAAPAAEPAADAPLLRPATGAAASAKRNAAAASDEWESF